MNKKNLRLNKTIVKKESGYVSGDITNLIRDVQENKGPIVRINFEVEEELRNEFKAIAAKKGKKIKDVLLELMTTYINKNI